MKILDGIVEWIAEQVMNILDLITTGGTATAFVKAVLTDRLILNPDFIDEQISVINGIIADSGIERKMSACISRSYNSDQLYQMTLELRWKIECALWPYIDLKPAWCLIWTIRKQNLLPIIL